MTTFHMIVGSLTVGLFLINTVLYYMEMGRETIIGSHKMIAFAASGLLLLQYVLGFILLSQDRSITWMHYVIALVAILAVGYEHMSTARETDLKKRASGGFIASLVAFILITVAYGVAEMA